LKSTQKDGYSDTQHDYILGKKISDPYLVKPNLTLPEKSCFSAWIFDLEFFQKYFCASQAHRKPDPPRLF
jgi:hypothetical protein